MNILLTGSTGLIGTALTSYLAESGHNIYPLHRNPSTIKLHYWIPEKSIMHLDDKIKLDVVIHLAGENIASSRWSKSRKDKILNSRILGTRLLSESLAELDHKPELFISGSAIGFYGETGDNTVDEDSSAGKGFLTDIATQWEAATQAAQDSGIRTIHLRTGIVLSPAGGVLQKMLLPFKLGLGGIVGNGQQYMSWISIDDVAGVINHMVHNSDMSGPYNLVAPNSVSNREFTRCLGKVLHRPTLFPLPAVIARILFGEMADALLLSSCRVKPSRLETSGYKFLDNELEAALSHLILKKNTQTAINEK